MKYFFLSHGWITDRVWEFGGLWNEAAWQRKPNIQKLELCIQENSEKLWLYQVEDDVLMIEVKPEGITQQPIGQVVLKRLISADQVIQKLCTADQVAVGNHLDSLLPTTLNAPPSPLSNTSN
ncbi:MAG: hypothetical protein AAF152_19935 [Cyanobacteria bacterium P01_A01_bin.114]